MLSVYGRSKNALAKLKEKHDKLRLKLAKQLMGRLYFINKNGQPLQMMPKLELDPALRPWHRRPYRTR